MDWRRLCDQWQLPSKLANDLLSKKPTHIIGADEAGTGALAGPVMVCAAAAPVDWVLPGLNDSKQVTRRKRTPLYEMIHQELEYVPLLIPSTKLDEVGLSETLRIGYTSVIESLLTHYPDAWVIIDGNRAFHPRAHTLIKGDGKVPAIMAASIAGKVLRDFHMVEMNVKYPGYGFNEHVGYNAKKHWKGIDAQGLTPLHRRSYGPIRKYLEQEKKQLARAAMAQG